MGTPANGTEIQPFITTVGRETQKPHMVQIRVYYWNGRLIGTSPFPKTRRDWVLNILANPQVTIQTETKVMKATAKVLEKGTDLETKENVARFRIGWRSETCPVFEPDIDAFVEFFPEAPTEALFDDLSVVHSPDRDPLPAPTLPEIMRWQGRGDCYPRQLPEEKKQLPASPPPV
ncbi:MAG: nitroreductase family deazaflavin-dependent oxidoreductase [Candidatus Tectomicrobia bacterium]|nr:nitroreductase family deazaflavin-dependent oxidoreductase [Candidatus Tectomicrobia bacterium]